MSKIMNEIYAEARVAREKAVSDRDRRAAEATGGAPKQASPRGIEWCKAQQLGPAGCRAASDIAFTAIGAIKHACGPLDHIAWWARTSTYRTLASALSACHDDGPRERDLPSGA
jgi:hypothetical protein